VNEGTHPALIRALSATPTYVLANAISNVVDLVPPGHRPKVGETNVYCGVQLSGPPHLGTAMTLLLTLCFAERSQVQGLLRPVVSLDVLDNVPSETVVDPATGAKFRRTRTAADATRVFEENYEWFREIASQLDVPVNVRIYSAYQRTPGFRRALLATLEKASALGRCLNPRSEKLPIRFACPQCGLVEVHAHHTELISCSEGEACFRAYCFDHGAFEVIVSETSEAWVDLNSLYRNVVKDIEHFEAHTNPAISVKGSDWIVGCDVLTRALSLLGVPESRRPYRLFTPTIMDGQGAKLSKSAGIADEYLLQLGTKHDYPDRPRALELCAVARALIDHPPLFFRSYSAEFVRSFSRELAA